MDPADVVAPFPRVLLVEDDEANRRRLRDILTAEGIAVVGEAADGASAARMAHDLQPDVVLMDLRMPVMGGLESTRVIKDGAPLIQVVVLTSYDGPLPSRSAEQAGAYAYLVKGCSAQLIRDVVFQAWKYKMGLEREHQLGEAAGWGTLFEDPPHRFGAAGARRRDRPAEEEGEAADGQDRVPVNPFRDEDPVGGQIPDEVPDDFVQRFGREARQEVRYRASRRYRWQRSLKGRSAVLRDREVWTVAIVVFGLSVFALSVLGALVYVVMLWPWLGLFIVTPLLVLLPFSLWAAGRIVARERRERDERGRMFTSGW